MSRRTAARLAWGLWALYLLIVALLATLLIYASVSSGPKLSANSVWLAIGFAVGLFTFATVGAVIASRRPENPVGWIMCAFAPLWLTQGLAETYAELASLRPDSLAGGAWMAWVGAWLWLPALTLPMVYLPLLFPNGRLLSSRWRLVAWIATFGAACWIAGEALAANLSDDFDNPLTGGGADTLGRWLRTAGWPFFVAGIVGAALSMVLRLVRAKGVERQQLKWFAYAAALMAVGMALSAFQQVEAVANVGWSIVILMLLGGFPIAIGVAVLRYRLYDIDRIINRTLVYGLLTAALGLTYFGLVIGLEPLFEPFTGGSDVAIALTTLVVAALFLPARQRIQDAVDHRFNRRRYDAAKTLEAFSARLRDEVDMETLQGDLIAVVNETVQPAHVSLWLAGSSPAGLRVAEAQGVTISGRGHGS
ncbi:MAG: hypothetical protein WEE64_00595 [Dehalococcoidia bacterium]